MATANADTGIIQTSDDASVNATIAHAKKLPKQAQEKVRALSRAWASVGRMRSALYDGQQEVQARRAELSVQIGHLKRTIENQRGVIGAADHKRLADLEADHAECLVEISEIAAESAKLPSPYDPSVFTAFLANAGNRRLKTSIPTVKLRTNQSAEQAITEIRNEISDAVEAIEAVRTAPLPSADGIANAVAEIERVAARGQPYFGRCRITEPGVNGRTRVGTIRWPKFFLDNEEHADAFSLAVWANADALKAKAKAELESLESEEAMSLAGRKERVADIESLILSLERKEEVLISMAEAEGSPVSRRSTMNPLAILGVEFDDRALPAPKPKPEPEETDADRAASLRRARLRDRTLVASEREPEGVEPNFG